MKNFKFSLDKFQAAKISGVFRRKIDIVMFWMNAMKLMLSYVPPEDGDVVASLVLHVDKMSRVFVESEHKLFSVSFPFNVYLRDGHLVFGSLPFPDVDQKVTSDIISLLANKSIFDADNVYEFADPLIELVGDQVATWQLLRDLMLADDGYVRIDHDPINENGALHPLNHLDVFYSQSATFKLGLDDMTKFDAFHDLLNLKTDCHFVRQSG